MAQAKNLSQNSSEKYELVPPEGGWGYIVTFAIGLMFIVTIVPVSVFAMVFGPFLSTLGDETGATTLINGVFNTSLFFAGLPANRLLQKYSCRTVGLIGACVYFIGSLCTIFASSIFQMVISFGVLQGLGFGLLLPSGFASTYEYFIVRRNLMAGVSQSIIGAVSIAWPALTNGLMERYGFRGTAAIFSALSLHAILAACTWQPGIWHYKKQKITGLELETPASTEERQLPNEEKITQPIESEPLMEEIAQKHATPMDVKPQTNKYFEESNKKTGIWASVAKSLDLALLKDPVYINLVVGASSALTSDIVFLSIIPVLLESYGFDKSENTLILTVFFVGDLGGRVILSIISAIFKVWNRYVVLIGAILSTIFRIAFTINTSFWWVVCVSAILGLLRGCIQIPYPLVFAEKYGPRFKTAFSLNMVLCGFVSLSVGVLSGVVKDLTKSNIMVVHMLTLVYAICAVPWLLEVIIIKFVKKKDV